jgi:hypothetical protein
MGNPIPMKKTKKPAKKTKPKKPAKKATKKKVKKPAKKTAPKKAAPVAAPMPEKATNGPSVMTAEQFATKFLDAIAYSADVSYRDDKEGDFPHRGIPARLALEWTANSHKEIQVTDLDEVLSEMEEDEGHPISEMIWEKIEG